MGGTRFPFPARNVCFLEMTELEGPGRRQKPPNGGGGERDLAIGGIGFVQRLLNRRKRLGLVTDPSRELGFHGIGESRPDGAPQTN